MPARPLLALSLCLPLFACRSTPDDAQRSAAAPEYVPGLLEVAHDPAAGTVRLRLPSPGPDGVVGEYLYVAGLTGGLGSNPLGLDRGLVGETRVVRLRRLGGRLLVEAQNTAFRASGGPDERRAARESFARSVLWSGEVEERAGGALEVDATGFFVRDALGVARALARADEGSYALDPARSGVEPDGVLVFPDNVEVDALLTFGGEGAGREVRATAPAPEALSLVVHHSLVRLPDAGFRPRAHDPRAGAFAVAYRDYSAGLDRPVERRLAVRHRLERGGPPLVYYVDRGAPEPIQSALVEGASWWAEAFAAAGFPGRFRVELLPEGAHPLDVRYDVIQWVHRATRGWSYGGGVTDPRTGEMIKGHVRLGSLRIRQDRLLFEGLVGVERTGSGAPDDPLELALARIRQLAAHEVGHTLGLAHNFAASTYGGRASVMDYPAPLVKLAADGALDLSEAYGVGVGEWDVQAIRWLYGEYGDGDVEAAALDAIVAEGLAAGRLYLSDDDARPAGAAEPRASLWDNGADAVAGLEQALAVRAAALARFGERNVRAGEPGSRLEEVLAPLYLHHRYALAAAAKKIGGATYSYGLAGDGGPPVAPVPGDAQRAALERVASLLAPRHYVLDDALLALLAPAPPGVDGGERFAGRTGRVFDPLAAAETAAALAMDELLQPERAARLVAQHARDATLPALDEVLEAGTAAAFAAVDERDGVALEIARAVQALWIERLIALATDPRAPAAVRMGAEAHLEARVVRAVNDLFGPAVPPAQVVWLRGLVRRIERFGQRTLDDRAAPTAPEDPPPGSPIGGTPDLAGCAQGG